MFKTKRTILCLVVAAMMLASALPAMAAEGPIKYDTPQSFTMWCSMDKAAGAVADWSENLVYQTMAKLTNVTVKFLHPPVGGETEAFNLMIASGDYPDAIQYGWQGVPGGPANYINDDVIIPLNDLMAESSPYTMSWLNAHPNIRRQAMMDDGTFYVLPAIYGDIELATSVGPMVREDMLPLIGYTRYDLPTTVQGWEDMLIKVRETPEMSDIIPLFFVGVAGFQESPHILGAFGITQEFYQVDGVVEFGAIQPEYKEFLTLMRKWFSLGLLDPEFAANTAKLRDEKVTNNQVFTFMGSMGNSITRYTAMARPTNPAFTLIPMKYPTLVEGETPIVGNQGNLFTGSGVAITTSAKDPALIAKFFDYFYSDEGHILSNWGIEDQTFAYDDQGKPYFLPLVDDNPEGLSREQAMAKYTIWQSSSPVYKMKDVLEQRDKLPEQIEGRKEWMACKNEILMPPVTPTSDEASEFAGIFADVQTYYREQATKIIMGSVDLDAGFDAMVATLKGMGIDRAIELRQAALDRYLARP